MCCRPEKPSCRQAYPACIARERRSNNHAPYRGVDLAGPLMLGDLTLRHAGLALRIRPKHIFLGWLGRLDFLGARERRCNRERGSEGANQLTHVPHVTAATETRAPRPAHAHRPAD